MRRPAVLLPLLFLLLLLPGAHAFQHWGLSKSSSSGSFLRPQPPRHRRGGVVRAAIEAGEWVVVKETGRRARVVSKQSNGTWAYACMLRAGLPSQFDRF